MDANKTQLVYMDYNATTPCDRDVVNEMLPYFTQMYGNAASIHYDLGWYSKTAVDNARKQVANLINADQLEIIFTSGATEGNNLAIRGVYEACKSKGNHLITCKTEHKATLDTLEHLQRIGANVTFLDVDDRGMINLDELGKTINKETILVCLMYANNETGVIHPFAEIGELCKKNKIMFMCDATQAVGKVPIDVKNSLVDILTFSAHKMYGPKGVGAVFIKDGHKTDIMPQITGGGHENGMRSGTLNVPAIVGFGKAAENAMKELESNANSKLVPLRNQLEDFLIGLGEVKLNGGNVKRLPHVTNISFFNIDGKRLLKSLNKFLAVSSGSACSSASLDTSHVLKAMGISSETAQSTIRFSIGKYTTEDDIDFAINKIKGILASLRPMNTKT
ncbi:cysteine desulfurase [Flavobacterium sp. LS1R49]|uniref:cysteine desulfurase n=1 Tax=Flavobacterium shii TaxID=2987687 RepID=A0A9X2ZAA1_9FLAO|nr:cysteine desulfurase family protein [Flavobacterium shii]MCV9927069.1 cysteine desulfurase [Flavobacterium shii]